METKNEIALEDYPLAQQYHWHRFGYSRFKSSNKPRKPRHFLTPQEKRDIGIEYLRRSGGWSMPIVRQMASQYDISVSYMYRIARALLGNWGV